MSFLSLMTPVILLAMIALPRQIALAQTEPQSAASIKVTPSLANATAGAMPAGPGAVPSVSSSDVAVGSSDSIPDGTVVTMQNWQNYRQFMPEGMAALFEGRYFWKMPADVQMLVGPTIIHPLPISYMNATEKYSAQVKITELADGGLTLTGYSGGIPFPRPDEPHKGWKILANLWFRYTPHLSVNTKGVVCFIDNGNRISCKAGMKIYRQLSFNTDPGVPSSYPSAEDKYFSQFEMVEEPEQERYTAVLAISHDDLTRPEEVYVFYSVTQTLPTAFSLRAM